MEKPINNNIILIGMAGTGKSTIGILLAKSLGTSLLDTDLLIQEKEKDFLQNIIDKKGMDAFLKLEEKYILSLNVANHVIATGGSSVYSDEAMKHLQKLGKIIFLDTPFNVIEKRIKNITTRGLIKKNSQTLYDLFEERRLLYLKYAEVIIECKNKAHEAVIKELLFKIQCVRKNI